MKNVVLCGDCLVEITKLPEKSVDLIFTDLPYGTTKAKWDVPIDLKEFWVGCNRVLKPNGVVVLFAAPPFDKLLAVSNLSNFRYEWIWKKTHGTGHLNAKKAPMRCHEVILVFYPDSSFDDKKEFSERIYNPQMTYGHERKVSSAKHKRNCGTGELYGKSDNFKDYDSTTRYPS